MSAALLRPQVGGGVAARARTVPGEGVDDSDEGGGKDPSPAVTRRLSPDEGIFIKVSPLWRIVAIQIRVQLKSCKRKVYRLVAL